MSNIKRTVQHDVPFRLPLAALGRLTVIALVGCALDFALLMALIGQIILPLLICVIVILAVAGFVATGIRWAPLVGVLTALGTMVGGLFAQQYTLYHLTHPSEVAFFIVSLLIYVFDVVAVGAGIGAMVQNYRSTDRQTPRWLAVPLAGLAGFVLGAFLVALLVAMTPSSPTGTTYTNGRPTVHMGVSNFTQSTVTIAKGSKLLLVDDGNFPHILANGAWENGTPKSEQTPGEPPVNNLSINGNSVEIGPFTMAGTYHIYCTVHPGMNLTVVVQ